jgi:hypothetical protein
MKIVSGLAYGFSPNGAAYVSPGRIALGFSPNANSAPTGRTRSPRWGVRRVKVLVFSGCESHPASWSFSPVAVQATGEVTNGSKPWMAKGRLATQRASRAVTKVNAVQAPKTGIAGADPPSLQGKATAVASRGMTQASPRWSCRGNGDGTTQEETNATRETPVSDRCRSTNSP